MKKIMNEKLTITTSNPVRARFYEYPRFTYPWHFHSEYEIIYVEKGEGIVWWVTALSPIQKVI